MKRMIRVELKDRTICRMAEKAFDLFLVQDKIIKFERSDGWIIIGRDPLRGAATSGAYSGSERRSTF